jgi:hypothetical protein
MGTLLYLHDNGPWLWRVALRGAIGMEPASSWCVFELENATGKDLIVEVKNLNDKNWEVLSVRRKNIQARLGRADAIEIRLGPGERRQVVVPSFKNRDMALTGIFARSDWVNVSEVIGYPQDVALLVIPPHMTSDMHPDYAAQDNEYRVVTIESSDLQPIAPRVLMNLQPIKIDLGQFSADTGGNG